MKLRSDPIASVDLEADMIDKLRRVRRDALRLNSSVLEHLKSFQQKNDSFKTLPSSKGYPADADISVGSTCTALMALLATNRYKELWSKVKGILDKTPIDVPMLFRESVRSKWASSGLSDGNAFTTALVVRTAGFVVKAGALTSEEVAALKHRRYTFKNEKCEEDVDPTVADKSFREIVQSKMKAAVDSLAAGKDPASFAVSNYPAKASIAYWFLDGAINAGVGLEESGVAAIARWAAQQFHRQLIYLSAENDSLMDPPELAMAACLVQRIHRLCDEQPNFADIRNTQSLPSQVELTSAVKRVFVEQPESGIWYKYFPLFHFPHGAGAADYCFSFEFLEAVLGEFGSAVLRTPELLAHFEKSLTWCDRHVLHFVKSSEEHYRGWNSGGEVRTLAAGMPEAWATAAVHMFLNQLHLRISDLLDDLVLKEEFGIDRIAVVRSRDKLKRLIDVDLEFPNEDPKTLVEIIRKEILYNAQKSRKKNPFKLGVPRSALLFGPPGTSKTNLAKAIAEYLGWPIVIITPSKFLGRGLEQVHAQVDKVFRDLMDLRKCIVFFDEMDALAQTREGAAEDENKDSLDVTRLLLTTSMLPKLADLWEQAAVIFLMATNHRQHLDPAITRAHRFDLLLCVGPPPWSKKLAANKFATVLGISHGVEVGTELVRLVPGGSTTEWLLDLFTVSELGIFFDYLRRIKGSKDLLGALRKYENLSEFSDAVNEWARSGIALRNRSTKQEYDDDVKASRRQYYRKEKENKTLPAESAADKENKSDDLPPEESEAAQSPTKTRKPSKRK